MSNPSETVKLILAANARERVRVLEGALDWVPGLVRDCRDARSPGLLGEALLRLPASLGVLSERHDFLESSR